MRASLGVIALLLVDLTRTFAAPAGDDWYHPQIYSPPSERTPLILPSTATRPVVELSSEGREVAIAMLQDAAIIPLTPTAWRELKLGASANEYLERLINEKRTEVKEMYIQGLGTLRYDSNPLAKEIAAGWNKLKRRLHPYLVRAVAVQGTGGKFYAHVWRSTLAVTHQSTAASIEDDPLRQYASIIENPEDVQVVKSPIVVYLEEKPASFYTNIEILKLGQ